jgi:hypothetical protein
MSAMFAASLLTVFASAQGMGMGAKCEGGKCGSSMMKCGNTTKYGGGMMKCGGMMMGGCGTGMMGYGMMDDPELQKMMSDEMMAHRKQMMQQRMDFQKSMHKKMMSSPKVIKYMLTDILQDPAAFKKTLDENPDLKAKVKKAL